MPLPSLKAHQAADANAREYQKRVMLGEPPEQAAHTVGGPVDALARNEAGQALARAVESELDLLQANPKAGKLALHTREGRAAWLEGIMSGDILFEGAFGTMKEFPPAAKLAASRLRGLMGGDFVTKHEVKVAHDSVIVFAIPDNGRVPDELVVEAPTEE